MWHLQPLDRLTSPKHRTGEDTFSGTHIPDPSPPGLQKLTMTTSMLNTKRLNSKSMKHRRNSEPVFRYEPSSSSSNKCDAPCETLWFQVCRCSPTPRPALRILHKSAIMSLLSCLYLLLSKDQAKCSSFRATSAVPISLTRNLIEKRTCVSSTCFLPAAAFSHHSIDRFKPPWRNFRTTQPFL